jgi:hypothetical protein
MNRQLESIALQKAQLTLNAGVNSQKNVDPVAVKKEKLKTLRILDKQVVNDYEAYILAKLKARHSQRELSDAYKNQTIDKQQVYGLRNRREL